MFHGSVLGPHLHSYPGFILYRHTVPYILKNLTSQIGPLEYIIFVMSMHLGLANLIGNTGNSRVQTKVI